jgi:hypothetical protein
MSGTAPIQVAADVSRRTLSFPGKSAPTDVGGYHERIGPL